VDHTQTHPVGVPSTSDGHVAETATCTTHNKNKRRTSLTSVEFEPAIPGIERLHTYATNGDHLLEHNVYACIGDAVFVVGQEMTF